MATGPTDQGDVLRMQDLPADAVVALLLQYGLSILWLQDGAEINGSYWGAPEAGIVGTTVFVRQDTPVHSFLHETCHIICMSESMRRNLHGNAGSDDVEEAAVCYLQILLAEFLQGASSSRVIRDMDAWSYSFRLGNTTRWFKEDADDAREWLIDFAIIDHDSRPTFALRT